MNPNILSKVSYWRHQTLSRPSDDKSSSHWHYMNVNISQVVRRTTNCSTTCSPTKTHKYRITGPWRRETTTGLENSYILCVNYTNNWYFLRGMDLIHRNSRHSLSEVPRNELVVGSFVGAKPWLDFQQATTGSIRRSLAEEKAVLSSRPVVFDIVGWHEGWLDPAR